MKLFYTCILVICLIFMISSISLGAIHSYRGDVTSWNLLVGREFNYLNKQASDTWFNVLPDKQGFNAYLRSLDSSNILVANYYQNDFTFAEILHISPDEKDSITNVRGSYLFDFGLFLGFDYFDEFPFGKGGGCIYDISPGYRFKIQENGYVALSFDYLSYPDEDYNEISGYNLDLKYINDTIKLFAQVYSWTDEAPMDGTSYDLGVNVKANNEITWGLSAVGYTSDDEKASIIYGGLTWDSKIILLDAVIGSEHEKDGADDETEGFYGLSGMFKIGKNYALGLEYQKYEDADDPQIFAKFKYKNSNSEFNLAYGFENDTYEDSIITLNYEFNF